MEHEKLIPPRPHTPAELAEMYRVSTKTIKSWLCPHESYIGPRVSIYYTVLQVKKIFECIGPPDRYYKD